MNKTTAELIVPMYVWIRVKLETDPMTEEELEDYVDKHLGESILLDNYTDSVGIRVAGNEVGTGMFTSAEIDGVDSYTLWTDDWEISKTDGIKEEEDE